MFHIKNKMIRQPSSLKWPHCVLAKMHFLLSCPRKLFTNLLLNSNGAHFRSFNYSLALHNTDQVTLVLLAIFHSWIFIDCFSPSHSVSILNQRSWKDYVPGKLNMFDNSWRSHSWVKLIQTDWYHLRCPLMQSIIKWSDWATLYLADKTKCTYLGHF